MTRSAIASNASPAASDTGLPMTSLRYSMSSTIPLPRAVSCPGPGGPSARQRTHPVRIVACSMALLSPFTMPALLAAWAAGEVMHTILGEAYVAEADRGAFAASLRDLPAHVSGWGDLSLWRRVRARRTARLDQATLSTGFPGNVAETRLNLDHFTNLLLRA